MTEFSLSLSRAQPYTHTDDRVYLQGKGSERRDGDEGRHEERRDVADGGERHAGPRPLQTLARTVLTVTQAGGRKKHQISGKNQLVSLEIKYNYRNTDMSDSNCSLFLKP